MPVRGPVPTFAPISHSNLKVTREWALWFEQISTSSFPEGVSGVIDGSAATTGIPTTIYQDVLANSPEAAPGNIFFSTDTGAIYTVNSSGAWQIQSPALLGDVTKPAFSNITVLSKTGVTPGTYTTANVTVDAKGRITNIESGTTEFEWPVIYFGDLIVGYSNGEVQPLHVGGDGEVLTADSNAPLGVTWRHPTGGNEALFTFNDAVPVITEDDGVFITQVPNRYVIEKIEIIIVEPFDDPTITIQVGYFTNENYIMDSIYINPFIIGSYELTLATENTAVIDAKVYVTGQNIGTLGRGFAKLTVSSKPIREEI